MTTTPTTVCPKMAVAVEIAAKKWVVASYAGGARKPRRKVLQEEAAEARFAALLAELKQARLRLGVVEDAKVLVAYEAGQEGFWLVRALRTHGIAAEVIDPVSLQVDRRARRAKTDRLDAEALVRALWRYMEGDRKALRMIAIPDPVAEDAREWQREQDRLQAQRRSCRDRIMKKLRTQGVWVHGNGWRAVLRAGQLHGFDGELLHPTLQAALRVELDRLEAAEDRLRQWQANLGNLDVRSRERMAALQRLRGIGPIGAPGLALQLYWRQFDNRRQVGSCTGLVGTPYDSGTMRRDQGISKAGNPKLRALLVELAWLWLRYQPDSALSRWFGERTRGAGKRGKRIMIVAVARRLAIALWRYLQQEVVPAGARFKPEAV